MIIIVSRKKRRFGAQRAALASLWLLAFFLSLYFLRSPSAAKISAKTALDVCAAGLIPSLFPFIVLVSVINLSGLSNHIARAAGRPLGALFGISHSAASAIILGALGGFPIGAVCTRELYVDGRITKSEAERLITFTNNASPAFCIGVIGVSLFGDTGFGVRLYICQIAAAVLIGVFQRKRVYSTPSISRRIARVNVSDILTTAISNAATTMLTICAFAVFFAVVGDALCITLCHYFGKVAAALAGAVCELTLGARSCAALEYSTSRIICAFAIGWSGISVHMQVSSILSETKISMRRYYLCKLLQGILTASLVFLFI